jgi:hypothetical protein
MRLSQNFRFWESNLRFMGKSGLLAAFPRAFHKTNRGGAMPRAAEVARKRLDDYLADRLKGEDDLIEWEFYQFLLSQAEKHKLDLRGYRSFEYKDDCERAKELLSGGPANKKKADGFSYER